MLLSIYHAMNFISHPCSINRAKITTPSAPNALHMQIPAPAEHAAAPKTQHGRATAAREASQKPGESPGAGGPLSPALIGPATSLVKKWPELRLIYARAGRARISASLGSQISARRARARARIYRRENWTWSGRPAALGPPRGLGFN